MSAVVIKAKDNLPYKMKYKSTNHPETVWTERWEGRGSQHHQIVTCPCPPTPVRSPKPSTVSSTAIWQASSHRTTIQIDISMRGPVPVFYKRHFTAVLFVLSPLTPPHRVETSPFFFSEQRELRRADTGGPLVMPHCPSIGVWVIAHKNWLAPYTSLLHMNEQAIVQP